MVQIYLIYFPGKNIVVSSHSFFTSFFFSEVLEFSKVGFLANFQKKTFSFLAVDKTTQEARTGDKFTI
jgi:hypothetical protein